MIQPTVPQHLIDYLVFALVRFLELILSILPTYSSWPLPDWSLAPLIYAGHFLAFLMSPFGEAGELVLTAFQFVVSCFFWLFPLWVSFKVVKLFRSKPVQTV